MSEMQVSFVNEWPDFLQLEPRQAKPMAFFPRLDQGRLNQDHIETELQKSWPNICFL
jgi:hypothetical protein